MQERLIKIQFNYSHLSQIQSQIQFPIPHQDNLCCPQ